MDVADLGGANLIYANLRGAHLTEAAWNTATVWPQDFDPAAVDPAPTNAHVPVLRLRVDTGGALSTTETREYVDQLMSVVELVEALIPTFEDPPSDGLGTKASPPMVVQRMSYENPLEVIMAIATAGTTVFGLALKNQEQIRKTVDWIQDRQVRSEERKTRMLEARARTEEADRRLRELKTGTSVSLELPDEQADVRVLGWASEHNVEIEAIAVPQ